MLLLLGTAIGVLVMGVAAGARHRARHRWVSPYTDLARAMRRVTRTEGLEYQPTSGIVSLHAAAVPRAEIVDIGHARAARVGHTAAS